MIIGISGKKQSGKDTLGAILSILLNNPHLNNEGVLVFLRKNLTDGSWQIRKFAEKLKDMVCLLINCTREQLEDEEFKEKELGEEWWYYTNTLFNSEEKELVPYLEANEFIHNSTNWYIIKLTPRLLLQLLGTECGRQILHPDIWVNSLMSEYKDEHALSTWGHEEKYPNWIITDLRFPNELKAVKDKKGIIIRVNRTDVIINSITGKSFPIKVYRKEHESETALDNAEFDYVIDNNGSLEELVEKIREILIKEKLL